MPCTMGSYDPSPPRTALEEAHETYEATDGRRVVKYPFAFRNLDWDEYHRFRPRYPDSMIKRWMSYHRDHGNGSFQCAHDVGAGPGTVAMRLGPYFDHVIVSDAGQNNIASAKRKLASSHTGKFTFIHAPAETTASTVPPASVDFVSVGMAFHYFDATKAIRAIATMLKPGGTLAAVTYGFRLRFPGRPDLEALWYRAVSDEALRLIRGGKLFPAAVKGLTAAMAGFDSVPLPTELFEPGAQRLTVNADERDTRPLCFLEQDPCWTPAPDRTAPTDVRRIIEDRNWRREANMEWLRGFLASCRMGFGEQTWATQAWRLLDQRVQEAGGRVAVEWPVAMILATRKARPGV